MQSPIDDWKSTLRLLPCAIDDAAKSTPELVLAAIANTTEVSDGFRDITALEFANAVNCAAWYIDRSVGRSSTFETLTYIGPSDLCYPIIAVAAAKTGYKIFYTSPRNSFEAHKSLLAATRCKVLATPAQVPAGIGPVLEAMDLQHLVFPPLSHWLDSQSGDAVEVYPFEREYADARADPFMIIHTSGTTGIPKPIEYPFAMFTTPQTFTLFPEEHGSMSVVQFFMQNSGRILAPFPMFHGAGIFLFFAFGLHWHVVPVLPPSKPLTAEMIDEIHRSGAVTCSMVPPAILEDIAQSPQMLESLERLKYVTYSSAPLSEAAGNELKKHVRLVQQYAQTETGMLHQLLVEPDDYRYVTYSDISNVEFRHRYDDLYEPVVVKKAGLEESQMGFQVAPEFDEIPMRDLCNRHPDPLKSNLFTLRGRIDDVIVFQNGEKLNPVTMEEAISQHSRVAAVLIVGQGRFQSAVLLEPTTGNHPIDDEERAAFIEDVWPLVEQANRDCPAHGRLVKELIVVLDRQRTLERTFKGRPSRNINSERFDAEIEAAYASLNTTKTEVTFNFDVSSAVEIKNQLRNVILQTLTVESLTDDDDFYTSGVDSLQTLQLSRALNAGFAANKEQPEPHIRPSTIYANSTINKLSAAIQAMLAPNWGNGEVSSRASSRRAEEVDAAVEKHMPDLRPGRTKVVVLTGSTGSLGSYLLSALIEDPTVNHIYCLNRSSNAAERQAAGNRMRGLQADFNTCRVTFLQYNGSDKHLGLTSDMYDNLLSRVTDIIDNAWAVNFNKALSSFDHSIASVRHLVEFAHLSPVRPSIFFTSSVGTARKWAEAGNPGPVPEKIVSDVGAVEEGGYPESKYVAERLLEAAWTKAGVDVCVLRVGQIAGPVRSLKGLWNPHEWLPSIIASSAEMGLLPNSIKSLGVIDWIPIDILTDVIMDIFHGHRKGSSSQVPVYNLVNPRQTTWQALVPAVKSSLSARTGREVKLVEYEAWLEALAEASRTISSEEGLKRNPAVKLLDFFLAVQGGDDNAVASWSTENAQQASKTMEECDAVKAEWMEVWMRQWGFGTTGKNGLRV